MRCRYCFESLPDRTKRCPHCGSRQPIVGDEANEDGGAAESAAGGASASGRRLLLPVLIAVVILGCVLFVLSALLAPGILPEPVIAALNLGTAVPAATPQLTRADIVTPTPFRVEWQDFTSDEAGVSIRLPATWIIINQANSGWRDEVRDLAETYGWAESLFETGRASGTSAVRAADPDTVNIQEANLVVFAVGRVDDLAEGIDFDQLEQLARDEPETLTAMVTSLSGSDFSARRREATTVNGREALLVEFNTRVELAGRIVPGLVRMYFVQSDDELYLVSYFVDEQSAVRNQSLYQEIVQSFDILHE